MRHDPRPRRRGGGGGTARRRAVVFGLAVLLGGGAAAGAADLALPPVNLGDTNFQDGIAFPGWLVQETVSLYRAGGFRDAQGGRRPGSNRVEIASAVTHVAWMSRAKLLGAWYGMEVLVPFARVDVHTDFGPRDADHGLGDVTVCPAFLQWPEVRLGETSLFQRFNFLVKLPTGDYESRSAVNVGANLVSLNPYYAATWAPTRRLEASLRLHYLYSFAHRDPFDRLQADRAQPGQAVHANLALSVEVVEGLRLGLAGYGLKQVSDDRLDGEELPHSREQVFALGPGLKFRSGPWSAYLHLYREFEAENRPQGSKGVFRLARTF